MLHLKYIRFEGFIPNNPLNVVACKIYPGDQIVFTGLHNHREGQAESTINRASEIITAIAEHEQVDPQKINWFDLQTSRGFMHYKPREYTFNQVSPEWKNGRISGIKWQEGYCNQMILEDFELLIRNEEDGPLINRAARLGYLRPLSPLSGEYSFGRLLSFSAEVGAVCQAKGLTDLEDKYADRVVDIIRSLCEKLRLDPNKGESLGEIPRETLLGSDESELFSDIIKWVTEMDEDLKELFIPVLFYI